ncbi:MAG: DUF362 domain-containing protein, partial [Omnitrophica bacterium]|nr:DUF362 domain-containing protein [Candidatus Omnitrophota bacterium]
MAVERLSKVYFISVDQADSRQLISLKLTRLLKESRLFNCLDKGDRVAIKVHFGDEGNTGFVRPQYIRVIRDVIVKKQASCFVADTNTLYRGRRMNSEDHLELAYQHKFTPDVVGAEVLIPDDTKEENISSVVINRKFVKTAKIARIFVEAEAIVDVSHFKGHMMTGFGGAIKNMGMGCATREGKLVQHGDVAPVITRNKCVGCEVCVEACPVEAISIKREKAYLNSDKCIGCASCIAACKYNAIDVDWDAGEDTIQERM